MKGYIITFTGKNLTTVLLGRIVLVNYRGRKTHYYSQGLLHAVKFKKLLRQKYFIVPTDKKTIDTIKKEFDKRKATYTIEQEIRDFDENRLINAA